MFHRAEDRITRKLDDNEQTQRCSQSEQDGSEVRSVLLEALMAMGQSMPDHRDRLECSRDNAARYYSRLTGSPWAPRFGSGINHRNLTASVIDSHDFIGAKKRADTEVYLPEGTKAAITDGLNYTDHKRIWALLDKVRTKHADMVLLHSRSPRGAEHIAGAGMTAPLPFRW